MSVEERTALAWAPLKSLDTPEQVELVTTAVLSHAGFPLPAFLTPMSSARFWASVASRTEHKAYALAAYGAMSAKDRADGETANVAGQTAYATTDRAMSPDHNLGIQMRITRKTLKQSGAALEQAVRRDMGVAIDQAAFLGTGANGQPLGVITGAATYGIRDKNGNLDLDVLRAFGNYSRDHWHTAPDYDAVQAHLKKLNETGSQETV